MITFKSRISELIQRLEAGQDPTPDELRRLQRLQALDIAKAGEDYLRQSLEEEARRTEQFRQVLEV